MKITQRYLKVAFLSVITCFLLTSAFNTYAQSTSTSHTSLHKPISLAITDMYKNTECQDVQVYVTTPFIKTEVSEGLTTISGASYEVRCDRWPVVVAELDHKPNLPGVPGLERPQVGTTDAVLTWSTPVKREDGTDLSQSEIDHYNIYYARAGDDTTYVERSNGNMLKVTGLSSGGYVFTVMTVDTNGLSSKLADLKYVVVP